MKVLVVDDHVIVREGVRRLLAELPAEAVYEAETPFEALYEDITVAPYTPQE